MRPRTPSDPDRPGARFLPPDRSLMVKAPMSDRDLETAVERAELWLGFHRFEFLHLLERQMADLRRAFRAIGDTRGGAGAVSDLSWMVHEIGGMAGTFGYNALTEVCAMLCRYLENRESLDLSEIEIVELHVNAIELAASKRLDEETPEAARILDGLNRVVARAIS